MTNSANKSFKVIIIFYIFRESNNRSFKKQANRSQINVKHNFLNNIVLCVINSASTMGHVFLLSCMLGDSLLSDKNFYFTFLCARISFTRLGCELANIALETFQVKLRNTKVEKHQ